MLNFKQTRNSKVLMSFTSYCERHPDERFWQALRNWSGFAFIGVSDTWLPDNVIDTFNWEGQEG